MNIDRLISGCNNLFKTVNNPIGGGRNVKQDISMKGAYKWTVWVRNGAVQFGDRRESPWIHNIIVNLGKDGILKTLGNKVTAIYLAKLGIGNGIATPNATDNGLTGTSTYTKAVIASDIIYVRPNLILTVQIPYTDANFTWNEFTAIDNNDVTVSRTTDSDPLTKTASMLAMLQYSLSI